MTDIARFCQELSEQPFTTRGLLSVQSAPKPNPRVASYRRRKTPQGTCACGKPAGARGKTCGEDACRKKNFALWQAKKRAAARLERERIHGPTKFGPKPKAVAP